MRTSDVRSPTILPRVYSPGMVTQHVMPIRFVASLAQAGVGVEGAKRHRRSPRNEVLSGLSTVTL
jgi:hypothetical protein